MKCKQNNTTKPFQWDSKDEQHTTTLTQTVQKILDQYPDQCNKEHLISTLKTFDEKLPRKKATLFGQANKKKTNLVFTDFCTLYADISIQHIHDELHNTYLQTPQASGAILTTSDSKYKHYLKIAWFIFYSSLMLCFEVLGGMAGIFELCQYLCQNFHWVFVAPAVFAVSIAFGFVAASVGAAFDIKAVADNLNISYFTARKELKILLQQTKALENIHHDVRNSILQLNETVALTLEDKRYRLELHEKLQVLLKQTANNQAYVCTKIDQFHDSFKKSAKKRLAVKIFWMLLAAPLYAAAANMTAVYIFGAAVILGATPFTTPIGLAIAFLWIASELYRFYQLEYQNMASGVDALLGTPSNTLTQLITSKKELSEHMESNQKDNQQHIDALNHQIHLQSQLLWEPKRKKPRVVGLFNQKSLLAANQSSQGETPPPLACATA